MKKKIQQKVLSVVLISIVFFCVVLVYATEHNHGTVYSWELSTKTDSDETLVNTFDISTASTYGEGVIHFIDDFNGTSDDTIITLNAVHPAGTSVTSSVVQSFTSPVTGIRVAQVWVRILKGGSPIGILRARLYNASSSTPIEAEILANSSTTIVIEDLTASYTWSYFNFTGAPVLTAGTVYCIGLYVESATTIGGANVVRVALDDDNEHVGTYSSYYTSAWHNGGGLNDFRFVLYGTTEVGDAENPTYSDLSSSTTDKGTVCDFNATFNDETALHSSGTYYFSTNNTGTWANNTVESFVSTPETISVQKTLNSTIGQVVGSQWFFSDNAGNWNSTGIETLTITELTVASYGIENQDNSSKKTKVHPSATSGKSGHSQEFTGDPTLYFYSTKVYMKKVGSPIGVMSASLYNEAGGLPTTLVENSITTVTMESLTTDFALYEFNFSRTTKFSAQDYAIAVLVDSATVLDESNYVLVGTGGDGTGDGKKNGHYKNGGWEEDPNVDMIFYIYGGTVSSTPTYSSVSHSSTEAGIQSLFNITVNDDVALESGGQYIFATNNTGTWVLDSAINFTSTPESVSTSKTLNSTFGLVVGYRWFIDDHAGNANNTAIYTLTITDTTPPTYSAVSKSTSEAGGFCLFNITVNDNSALESDGQYQFATNNTGSWVWDSVVNFTSTPQTITVTKQLNETLTQVVGYRWNITDNQGNSNSTAVSTLTIVADGTAPTISGVAHSSTGLSSPSTFSGWVADTANLVDGGYIFSQNTTASWENSTYVPFTENLREYVYTIVTLGSAEETVVGYCWYFNDTAGNWGVSSTYSLTTDDAGMGGGGGDGDSPPDGDIVPLPQYRTVDLAQSFEELADAIRNVPPWVIWGALAILGSVAVVGMFNKQLGKKVGKYGRAPKRKIDDTLTAKKEQMRNKIKKPKRSRKLFD